MNKSKTNLFYIYVYVYIYIYMYIYMNMYVYMFLCVFCIYHSQKRSKISSNRNDLWDTGSGRKKEKRKLSHLPLPTATLKKLRPTFCHCRIPQFVSSAANLYIICKTFILSYPSINKSKYKSHPRFDIAIIKRF